MHPRCEQLYRLFSKLFAHREGERWRNAAIRVQIVVFFAWLLVECCTILFVHLVAPVTSGEGHEPSW